MIILDTNILRAMPQDGVQIAILRAIKNGLGHRVALPVLVVEEYGARLRREEDQKVQQVIKAHQDLNAFDPDWPLQMPDFRFPGSATSARIQLLSSTFEVLELPEHAATQALVREIQCRPPASTSYDKPGSGARDVAIWLTALSQCKTNPEETVYFVSNDVNAFGRNSQLLPDLVAEVKGTGGTLKYCSDVAQLANELATRSTVDEEAVRSRLRQEDALRTIADWATHCGMVRQLHYRYPSGLTALPVTWQRKPDVQLMEIKSTEQYRIGEQMWASTTAEWRLVGPVSFRGEPAEYSATLVCTWSTRVLMRMDADEGNATALDVASWKAPRLVAILDDRVDDSDDEDDFEDHGIDDDSGYGPSSYFARAMAKDD